MNWLRKIFYGRYGIDELSLFLLVLMIVTSILSGILSNEILYYVSLIIMGFGYYRIFSRNHSKRIKENDWYLRKYRKLDKKLKYVIKRVVDFPKYKYFNCPVCEQKIRIPRGKGKVDIKCPKCRSIFERKT